MATEHVAENFPCQPSYLRLVCKLESCPFVQQMFQRYTVEPTCMLSAPFALTQSRCVWCCVVLNSSRGQKAVHRHDLQEVQRERHPTHVLAVRTDWRVPDTARPRRTQPWWATASHCRHWSVGWQCKRLDMKSWYDVKSFFFVLSLKIFYFFIVSIDRFVCPFVCLSGCAFVTFTARQMAQSAIKSMHQSQTMEVSHHHLNKQKRNLQSTNWICPLRFSVFARCPS